jgi:hypothetical protein
LLKDGEDIDSADRHSTDECCNIFLQACAFGEQSESEDFNNQ